MNLRCREAGRPERSPARDDSRQREAVGIKSALNPAARPAAKVATAADKAGSQDDQGDNQGSKGGKGGQGGKTGGT